MRILLIEDDRLIGDGIKAGLSKLGFSVDWFTSGESGCNALEAAPWDAVILDLSLPERDGLDILRQWRQQGNDVPVLILTARDALDQRVEGLQMGADDYLCKPFALTEVAARLQALIRRRHGQLQPELRHGNVVLIPGSHSVMREGETIELKSRELALLELLMSAPGRLFSRERILSSVWGLNEDPLTNVVDVYIRRLRSKIDEGRAVPLIQTMRGLGYRLEAPTETQV